MWAKFSKVICAPGACFTVPIRCSVSKLERFKGYLGRKLRPNFVLFGPLKIMGGLGEMSESFLRVQPRIKPLIYF